jgi:hypothetical protein
VYVCHATYYIPSFPSYDGCIGMHRVLSLPLTHTTLRGHEVPTDGHILLLLLYGWVACHALAPTYQHTEEQPTERFLLVVVVLCYLLLSHNQHEDRSTNGVAGTSLYMMVYECIVVIPYLLVHITNIQQRNNQRSGYCPPIGICGIVHARYA